MSAELFQRIRDIASLVLMILVIVLSIVTAFMKKSKNSKIREVASKLEVATSNVITVKSVILDFMKQAEEFINYTGSDKKSWVITKTKEFCIKNSVKYDDELIESTIETLIDFSKKVNATDAKQVEVAEEAAAAEKAIETTKKIEVKPVAKSSVTQTLEKEIKVNG